ncbi:NADH oxidase [Sporomusa rhizae]|uniref:NADH:flavin oxidoreductase n=1 Tax=Sporomusa rhizae TaxID=357999 RepID=UPI00352B02EC
MKNLFDQTSLSKLLMKNRFIRSATCENLAGEEGHITPQLLAMYEDLAKSGVGTIITGSAYISNLENMVPGVMAIHDDSFINEYKQLTKTVHRYGVNLILQIVYGGSQTILNSDKKVIWGPSAKVNLATSVQSQEMTQEDIKFVQSAFAAAALRAKQADFDGIQLHVAHGYLLSQFLSPYYNERCDEYGGCIENRARMILETYTAIREKVGFEYPIIVKVNSEDFMEKGATFEDCKYLCKKLAELGIDAVEVSGGCASSRPNEGSIRQISKMEQESYFKTYAAEIAQIVNAPVILVGGNREFHSMTNILNQTRIEYFALSRPLICENNLITRWQQGELKRAKCISCGVCHSGKEMKCVFL